MISYQLTPRLRFVIREVIWNVDNGNGHLAENVRILQQLWIGVDLAGAAYEQWQDVPLEDEA